jgi:ABC-type transport system substrate-binding protein
MDGWLCRASGILGLVVAVVLVLIIAYGPAPLIAVGPAAAQTPTAKPGEPFYLKAIDHEKAKRGGTLRLAAHGPPSMFDIYASGTIANVGAQAPMYDLLVRQDPRDPKLPIVPSLATSWTISPDGMTYTFKLRQGVKFHDGTDFEAADVKATFDRIVFPPPT